MLDELFCEAKTKNENPIAEEKDYVKRTEKTTKQTFAAIY
jgi:hypothetical protein